VQEDNKKPPFLTVSLMKLLSV